MNTKPPICRSSTAALVFWREQVATHPNLNPAAENFWVLTLEWDGERRLTGAHLVSSRAFGNSQNFADELFASAFLRGVPEFLLVHHRPGTNPEPMPADIDRARAIVAAGRTKKIEMLDCLLVGNSSDAHPSGTFSFRRLPKALRADLFK